MASNDELQKPPVKKPSARLPPMAFLILLMMAGTLGYGIWFGRQAYHSSLPSPILWGFAAALFGALVGLSEILSRYRDEPLLATATIPGIAYLSLNGLISMVAFSVLRRYPTQIFGAVANDLALSAVAAGFGAMVIFRSKLFTFRSSDGKDYPIGPAIVLDTILKVLDTQIDRRRATERQYKVFNAVYNVNFTKMADYIEASLPSFQNLSQDDKVAINLYISQYRASKFADVLKSLGLGFAFLTIAGDANFDLVIANVQRYAQLPVPPPAIQTPPGPPIT